jgi:hypothetical protein
MERHDSECKKGFLPQSGMESSPATAKKGIQADCSDQITLYDRKAAAAYLHCSVSFLDSKLKQIPRVKILNKTLFTKTALNRFIENCTTDTEGGSK